MIFVSSAVPLTVFEFRCILEHKTLNNSPPLIEQCAFVRINGRGRDFHVANIKVPYAVVSGDLRVKRPSQNVSLPSSLQRKHRGPLDPRSVMSPFLTGEVIGSDGCYEQPKSLFQDDTGWREPDQDSVSQGQKDDGLGRGIMENSP